MAKMAMPDLQQYPTKLCLIKHELYIHVFFLTVYFDLLFPAKVNFELFLLLGNEEKS